MRRLINSLGWPVALLLAVFFLAGCEKTPEVIGFDGLTMGTSFSIRWVDTEPGRVETLRPKVGELLKAVNQHMSTYIPDSELSLFNKAPAGSRVALSEGLAHVVRAALKLSGQTDGAYDVTVGPLVNLWGFGPDGRVVNAPTPEQLETMRSRVGYQSLTLSADGHLTKVGDQYVDLSSIAKGYGVDLIAQLLEQQGIGSYLVEIGGELRAKGLKPDGSDWRVAIESPVEGVREIERVISVKDIGIATSGDYRNYFEQDGVRFSHTIDPRTGYPIRHRLASVTVLRPTCMEADALATALMVLGEEEGLRFAQERNIAAFFIVKEDNGFREISTPEFEAFLKEVN
ncbi:thiamin biosynthesis lipoprotein ApbE [Marinobacterium zhoushanense]|uniref:FAD:protein FMN transferase n=1 Tax=Marinobacterium zhoushanense TaxID=1679163 RepID=A0ABQ1KKB8_9GAMM|nr:FAD:protein FMN transferase [Marinobacterium zhoushanense]GGC02888.1 thiamin biosynthesis lipoprotein ApbE [Marinobacterium zhoushanense]